ncbi:hypothetical protein Ahy_B06g082177 [Arachis hypogaea]|uniref:Uncharacterized protein n=1 Tax=Arachis hypogaea TaxID=3818 RepID=A0A444YN09_ARAHY|nr:hypothetical protein Ahy_B06g082177 [Arachis hypogaea]
MLCIRHIGSNFLRAFKAPHLQKLVVNIGYSRTVEEYNFNYKSSKAHRKRAKFTYSEFATQRIETNMQCAGNIVVHQFDRRNKVFEVCKMSNEKVEQLPCHHVIAYYANQRLDWQVYVNDVYKMSEVRKVYQNKFVPLGDLETWPAFLGPTLVANPTLRQTSKGGLKLTRYLNEMDSREMRGPQICRLSGRQGHSHSRCPQRAGLSGVSGSGGP